MASPDSSLSRQSSVDMAPVEEETMQLFVKNVSGNTTELKVPPTTSIATIKSLLTNGPTAIQPTPSENTRLVFAGKHLTDSRATLAELHIPPASTLHLALPMRGGMPPKKIRCSFKDCKEAAQRIVGDCGFCQGHFCAKHRMLESHNCEGLEDCKKESKERNTEKLQSERTQMVRGV